MTYSHTSHPTYQQGSVQQKAVYDFVMDPNKGSLNLIARAGTGKTTTLMGIAQLIKEPGFVGAFNKAIADEFKERLANQKSFHVKGGTIHSVGYGAWGKVNRGLGSPDSRKVEKLAKTKAAWDRKLVGVVVEAVGYAKQACLGVAGQPGYEDKTPWQSIIEYYDLADEIPGGITADSFIGMCQEVYRESLALCERVIDFADMLLAPLYFEVPFAKYKWVMIDEAQDTDTSRRLVAFAMMGPGSRMIAVGDPCQCQPGDTMVKLEGGREVRMDSLSVGDSLICYDRQASAFVGNRNQGRKVLRVASRHYSGRLLTVSAGGKHTRVTPNHKFIVRWRDRDTEKWVTYVMRKGDLFRVGWCQLFNKQGSSHLAQRARLEDADCAWIVGVHGSKAAASMEESLLSVKYGIPLPQFKENANCGQYTQDFLDEFWFKASLEVDLGANAARLLRDHGRDVRYPFYTTVKFGVEAEEGTRKRQGRTTIFETQACNMISSMMWVPVHGQMEDPRVALWSIADLSEETYSGLVYSLEVDTHHNYVADGVLTKNSIYGFAGASADSMGIIQKALNSEELPLTVTYRCPKSVVKLANTWVPDFTAHENAPQGLVTLLNHQDLWKQSFAWNDVILCRNTRPLVGIAQRLRDKKIPCMVEGMNGKGLVNLAVKWGEDLEIEDFREELEGWAKKETAKWIAKGKMDKVEYVQDKVGTLKDLCRGMKAGSTVQDLVRKIEFLFGQANDGRVLKLCTIHRSKGREWNRVYLVGRNRYMPSPYAKKDWELREEGNLAYVAVTRAKVELVEVDVPFRKAGDDTEWWEKGWRNAPEDDYGSNVWEPDMVANFPVDNSSTGE